jgi:hypothetical protein
MRVNIHPEPIGKFNFHLPYISAVYLKNYAEPFKKFQRLGITDITLVNNGEPPSRLYAAQSFLAQQGVNTKIESLPARYDKPDQVFNGQPYVTVPGAVSGCRELLEYYLGVYHELGENINQLVNTDIFYGFKKFNHLHWYHYGLTMPATACPIHLRIREMYHDVFQSYANSLSDFLGYTKQDVTDRLILRINHTSPGQYRDPVNRIFLTQHWDTSVMTGNIYKTHPGLNIRVNDNMVPVEDFYDQEKETLIIPGIDYCDEFETMADPTWHEVVDREITQDRASIVAFLKRRRFRE